MIGESLRPPPYHLETQIFEEPTSHHQSESGHEEELLEHEELPEQEAAAMACCDGGDSLKAAAPFTPSGSPAYLDTAYYAMLKSPVDRVRSCLLL